MSRPSSDLGRLFSLLGLLLASCSRNEAAPKPLTSARAALSVTSAAKPGASAPSGKAPAPGCRAIVMRGEVRRLSGEPLSAKELFRGDSWLELGKGASVTFKHSSTAREWTLSGPALTRPCRDGAEQVAIAHGKVTTGTGAGARPGAEVLLFTPAAVVRYGDAALTLQVDERKSTLLVKSGEAWVERAHEEPEEPAAQLAAVPLNRPRVIRNKLSAQQLEPRCESLAQRAAELGGKLTRGSPGARSELAARAVEHSKTRQRARVTCGIGEALAANSEPAHRGRLLDRFSTLDALSRTLSAQAGGANP